jgi:nucleoside-diphosphate-sugar epimerase
LDALFDGADVVVHAAGATRAPTVQQLYGSNVALTAKVLAAARAARAGRFVYLSSQAAAGPAASLEVPTTENAPPSPHESYGRSKLAAERLVRAGENPFVIVRPAAVYGPGDRDFLAMFRLARAGIALHAGNRDQWISIVHVSDVARAVVLMSTELRAVGGTFFVANDEPVQWKTLFADGARCAERSLSVDLEIPAAVVRAGAMLGDLAARLTGNASLLTSEKLALGEPPYWVCSNERAKQELGFVPSVPLHDGLCETYHWYLTNRWL